MPTAYLDKAEINYEVIGREGPWVVVIPGGRHSLTALDDLAQAIASFGYRVLSHDRRNCGRSSLSFDATSSEDDVWVDDLRALLDSLKVAQPVVVGQSRGARIGIKFTLRYPGTIRGLLLWGISGGEAAVEFFDDYYFGEYLRACELGGMKAVCALGHFAGLLAGRPANRNVLLEMDPVHFVSVMDQWRAHFLAGVNQPIIGVSDDELRTVGVPTAIVPYYDRMHPYVLALHAQELIPQSRFFDLDVARHESPRMSDADRSNDTAQVAAILRDFETSLPTV